MPHVLHHLPPRQIEKISRLATLELTIVQRKNLLCGIHSCAAFSKNSLIKFLVAAQVISVLSEKIFYGDDVNVRTKYRKKYVF